MGRLLSFIVGLLLQTQSVQVSRTVLSDSAALQQFVVPWVTFFARSYGWAHWI